MQIARESIFVSAIRSLINSFFAMLGILIGLVIILAASTTLSSKGNEFGDPGKTKIVIAPDADGNRAHLAATAPVVLKLKIHGIIGSEKLNTDTIQSSLLATREGALKDDRIKAILLDIDSPGGTVTDSDNIYRMLKAYKKKHDTPVYATVNGFCASGGMMIACAAEEIYSTESGIIGSVGVRSGPFFNFVGLMGKMGVEAKTLTSGKDKDTLNPYRKWKEDEGEEYAAIGEYDYNYFVNTVVENRPRIDRDKLINVYGAGIFDPGKAKEHGYIDEIGDSNDALRALVTKAKIEGDYQVIEINHYPSIAAQLLESSTSLVRGKVKHEISDGLDLRDKHGLLRLYLFQP